MTQFRVRAHPGFQLPGGQRRFLQSSARKLRAMLRPQADVLNEAQAQAALLTSLSAVEAVLDLHVAAKPAARGSQARRRIRLEPGLIGKLAQMRYVLSYALGRGALDNEPEMDWLQYRAYGHSQQVLKMIEPVLRGHRTARAGCAVVNVAMAS